jgi:AcrR family transcriptional regulator
METVPPRGVYRAHREKQVRRILEAAGRVFDERGIDRVTMAEILTATGVRASTLYEYFANKDEIVWALVGETMRGSAPRIQKAVESASGSAFAKIVAFMDALLEQLVERPEEVRFMAQFDALYAREWSAERLISLEAELFPEGFSPLTALIREGIEDGSLRKDLDPQVTMHAVLNCVIGTQRRLASLGSRVEAEYGQPVELMFREATRLLLQGLRAI